MSVIQDFDPRTGLLYVLIFAIWLSVQTAVLVCIKALFLSLFLLACHPKAWRLSGRRLKSLNYFLALLWLLLPFSTTGGELFQWGYVRISQTGVEITLVLTLKTYSILVVFTALLATVDSITLSYALFRLGVPAKLIHLLLFTVRYITVLEQTWQQLTRAMQARGFRWQTGWHTYYSIGNLLGMLIVRAVERAQQIEKAMKCRGYCGQFYCLTDFKWRWRDSIFLILFSSLLLTF